MAPRESCRVQPDVFDPKEKLKESNRALLVGIQLPGMPEGEGAELLGELEELCNTAAIEIVRTELVRLRAPSARFLVGAGKANELIELAKECGAALIIFDEDLSPAQQRNWEEDSGLAVIDRQEVILEVFAQRASTREAILQVALARMEYSLPRLRRAWTHLSRQRGGGTGARGQGETQLEEDRRIVRDRITRLRVELETVVRHRHVQRARRDRVPVPNAAIVGYTNAGKSSLLNILTAAGVFVEDKLVATLDPTTRQLALPDGRKLLLTDTVGFIRRLPHKLVEAFKATLEETARADFLIHVLDVTNTNVDKHHEATMEVLAEIGADTARIITVYNKIDAADAKVATGLRARHPEAVFLSARTGEGVPALLEHLMELTSTAEYAAELMIPHSRYALVSRLHAAGAVIEEKATDDGVWIRGRVPFAQREHFEPFVIPPGGNGTEPAAAAGD
jgi:GTP-binding protein HflX